MPETAVPPDPKAVLFERTRPITVDEYHEMGRAGVFAPDERVELLDGRLIKKSPADHRDNFCISRLTMLLTQRIFEADIEEAPKVFIQMGIRLDQRSEPEPDVTVLSSDAPETRTPTPQDVLMMIEVAHSSLSYDDGPKRIRYAEAGIPVYWIVNLEEETIDVLTSPKQGKYTERRSFLHSDSVPLPDTLPGDPIPVGDILGVRASDSSGKESSSDAGETE